MAIAKRGRASVTTEVPPWSAPAASRNQLQSMRLVTKPCVHAACWMTQCPGVYRRRRARRKLCKRLNVNGVQYSYMRRSGASCAAHHVARQHVK